MGPLRYFPLVLGAAAALMIGFSFLTRGRRKTPDQLERERRERISIVGRITDGAVMDVREITQDGRGAIQLLIYNYDVSGVSYEAAQDITTLRHFIDLHNCRIGLPASIKYDPQNPGDSIVIAEGWSGLR